MRDDSDELAVFFDHGKTAHDVLGHDSQRFIKILLRIDRDNLFRNDVGNLDLLSHHFRRVRNRVVGVDAARIRGHDVSDALTQYSSLEFRIARCVPRAIPDQTMKIQHMLYGERIRTLALSFPETYEDWPWGHPVFKVGDNKMFAAMSDGADPVSLTIKLTPEEREIALHFAYVGVARYVGRYGWVTADIADEESCENALEWLRESYWLNAPARLRGAVEGT